MGDDSIDTIISHIDIGYLVTLGVRGGRRGRGGRRVVMDRRHPMAGGYRGTQLANAICIAIACIRHPVQGIREFMSTVGASSTCEAQRGS